MKILAFTIILNVICPNIAWGDNGKALPKAVSSTLKKAGIPASKVSLFVKNLSTQTVIIEHNGDTARHPASLIKLVTTFAALELLGPAYSWRTEFYINGDLKSGTLDGDLIIKGYGDPKLDLESFWMALQELRSRGVKIINGNVILDRSYFVTGNHDPAAFDGKPLRPYNLGPDPLLVNYKSIRLRFIPNESTRKVEIVSMPKLPNVKIINNIRLTRSKCRAWPDTPIIDGNKLIFKGEFPISCGIKTRYYSVLKPDQYVSSIFNQLWLTMGGSLEGDVISGSLSSKSTLLFTHRSEPLSKIITDVNKYSSNSMARQIYLSLGTVEKSVKALSPSNSGMVLKKWFKSSGLKGSSITIDNGSGLSRKSRISARNLGILLERAWESPRMPEFISSLPISGIDGTIKRQFRNSELAGQAHLKTGYLKGVRAIAGYLLNKNKERLALCFIINHRNAKQTWPLQEEFVKWIYWNS